MKALLIAACALLVIGCQDQFEMTYPLPIIISDDLGDERVNQILEDLEEWDRAVGAKTYVVSVVHGDVETPCNAVQIYDEPGLDPYNYAFENVEYEDGEKVKCARRIRINFNLTEKDRALRKNVLLHEVGHLLLGDGSYDNPCYGDQPGCHDKLPKSLMFHFAYADSKILPEHINQVRHNMGLEEIPRAELTAVR